MGSLQHLRQPFIAPLALSAGKGKLPAESQVMSLK